MSSRRMFLGGITTAAMVSGVVAGVGGYYSGLASVPPKEVTKEVLVPLEVKKAVMPAII